MKLEVPNGAFREVDQALSGLDSKMQMSLLRGFNRKTLKTQVLPNYTAAAHTAKGREGMKIGATKKVKNKSTVEVGTTYHVERWLEGGTEERHTKQGWYRGKITENRRYNSAAQKSINPVVKYGGEEIGDYMIKIMGSRLKSTRRRIAKLRG